MAKHYQTRSGFVTETTKTGVQTSSGFSILTFQPDPVGIINATVRGVKSASFTGRVSIHGTFSATVRGIKSASFIGLVDTVDMVINCKVKGLKTFGFTGNVIGHGQIKAKVKGFINPTFVGNVTTAVTGTMSCVVKGFRYTYVTGTINCKVKGVKIKKGANYFIGTVDNSMLHVGGEYTDTGVAGPYRHVGVFDSKYVPLTITNPDIPALMYKAPNNISVVEHPSHIFTQDQADWVQEEIDKSRK